MISLYLIKYILRTGHERRMLTSPIQINMVAWLVEPYRKWMRRMLTLTHSPIPSLINTRDSIRHLAAPVVGSYSLRRVALVLKVNVRKLSENSTVPCSKRSQRVPLSKLAVREWLPDIKQPDWPRTITWRDAQRDVWRHYAFDRTVLETGMGDILIYLYF